MLFYRNTIVNFFPYLMKDHTMCLAVEEAMSTHTPLIRALADGSHMMNSVRLDGEANKVMWMNR